MRRASLSAFIIALSGCGEVIVPERDGGLPPPVDAEVTADAAYDAGLRDDLDDTGVPDADAGLADVRAQADAGDARDAGGVMDAAPRDADLPSIVVNNQEADLVLGQADMASGSRNGLGDGLASLSGYYCTIFAGKLAFSTFDRGVQVWRPLPSSNGEFAALQVGQGEEPVSQAGTLCATGVFLKSDGLWVSDPCSSRVLGFDALGTESTPPASVLVGKSDWTDDTASEVGDPLGLEEGAGYLWIADGSRILGYPLPVLGVGTAGPQLAVGQPNITNRDLPLAPSADRLYGANDIAVDTATGRLFVSDSGHNRVLIWNAIPSTSGVPADIVLGQADFTSGRPNRGVTAAADSLSNPSGLAFTRGHLFVSDRDNNRVLVWKNESLATGAAADYVLGQVDFASGDDRPASASAVVDPLGLCSDGTHLWVPQGTLYRATRFTLFPR